MNLFPQKAAWDCLKRQTEIATTSKTETKINEKNKVTRTYKNETENKEKVT
jgi:hypothetical protein